MKTESLQVSRCEAPGRLYIFSNDTGDNAFVPIRLAEKAYAVSDFGREFLDPDTYKQFSVI
jgi:hypothetical protein